MKMIHRILFLIIFCGGAAWIVFLASQRATPALPETLSPLFQMAGKAPRSIDRALTRVLPIDTLDEKEYGDAIFARFSEYSDMQSPEQKYLQELVEIAAKGAQKPFHYRAIFSKQDAPNAFALPGGVILVTEGLLNTLESEDELLAVLGHEVGHVEAGHCLSTVRIQLAAKKIGAKELGELADLALVILMRHSYSKTDEAQADDYGYERLIVSEYSPGGAARAFERLLSSQKENGEDSTGSNAVSEYFQTHPYLENRIERFSEKARQWRIEHPLEKRYLGAANLKERTSRVRNTKDEEWEP